MNSHSVNNESKLKIMTFNIRNGGNNDGINSICYRHSVIMRMLEREAPDIIGFQEISSEERRWIRKALGTEYVLVGGGRDANYRGEGCSVAFRSDILELIRMDTLWLSDTPNVSGSRYEDSGQSIFPRLMHVLTLKHKYATEPITVINTHLDHVGIDARRKELSQIFIYMSENKLNGILMGDFNMLPSSPEMSGFTEKANDIGWSDVTKEIGGTFHQFGTLTPATKIDYIYTNMPCDNVHRVTDVTADGTFCSDHFPICASIALP